MDLESAVSQDTASASVDSTATPDVAPSTVAPDSAAQPQGGTPASRTYSEEHFQKTLRERLEQQKRSFEKKLAESQKKQEEYERVMQRANAGIEAMGRGFGFIKDEPPKPVGHEDIQSLRESMQKEFQDQIRQLRQEEFVSRLKAGWAKVETSMPEFSKVRGFQRTWAEYQAESPDKDPLVIAKEIASEYEKIYASRANAEAARKDDTKSSAALRSTPAGGTPSKSETKAPLRRQLAAALEAARS